MVIHLEHRYNRREHVERMQRWRAEDTKSNG